MPGPLVSIVTPSYNQGRFIRATIESVLGQDYPHLEYIVMDGGSTDETASVAKDYASRLTFVSEKDRGQSHAINKGFQRAHGSILSWINSDDIILPGAVRAAVDEFVLSPAAGAVYGEGDLMDTHDSVIAPFTATEPFNLWKLVYLSDYILQQTLYFRRNVLDEVGNLDESLHYTMDWDLLIRVGSRYPVAYIPKPMGRLREYPEAKSFSGGAQRIREMRRMLQRHTGMRLPPAVITYGLNTYQQIWCREIGRTFGSWMRPLSRPLQFLVRHSAGTVIRAIDYYAQGLYADGWAAPSLRLMLPPGTGPITIEGYIPPGCSGLRGQNLRVIVNGQELARRFAADGDFGLTLNLPASLEGRLLHIHVLASRWVLPSTLRLNEHLRRLAFRFGHIRHGPSKASSAIYRYEPSKGMR